MYERWTDRARKALALANQEAQRLGCDKLDAIHILIGITLEGNGVACMALRNLFADPAKVREGYLGETAKDRHPVQSERRLPLTDAARQVVEAANKSAESLGHNYVGTEHALLGLLWVESAAKAMLNERGVTAIAAEREILALLGHERMQAAGELQQQMKLRQQIVSHLSKGIEEVKAAPESKAARAIYSPNVPGEAVDILRRGGAGGTLVFWYDRGDAQSRAAAEEAAIAANDERDFAMILPRPPSASKNTGMTLMGFNESSVAEVTEALSQPPTTPMIESYRIQQGKPVEFLGAEPIDWPNLSQWGVMMQPTVQPRDDKPVLDGSRAIAMPKAPKQPTPYDLRRLRDSTVLAFWHEWEAGAVSWDQMLLGLCMELVKQRDEAASQMLDLMRKAAPNTPKPEAK